MSKPPRIAPRVVCATDFRPESEHAFLHALALARAQRAQLTLLHIGPESRENIPWDRYPSVRQTLIKWGTIAPDTNREALESLTGIAVRKMAMRDEDPFHGIADYLRERNIDILVMATASKQSTSGLIHTSLAKKVALRTRSRALLLPESARGLIAPDSGQQQVDKVLFVYDHEPDPRDAVAWLNDTLPYFGAGMIEVQMLYIGLEKHAPDILLPHHPRLRWSRVFREGKPQPTILGYSDEFQPQLVIMMNQRAKGLYRRLRGSISSYVLQHANRAMLLIPES